MARSVRLALAGELVPDAVNVSGRCHRRGGAPRHRRSPRSSAASSPPSPARCRPRSTSTSAARSPQYDVSVWRARRAQGPVPGRRRGVGVLRQRPAARAGARLRGAPAHRRRSAPTSATSTTLRGTLADGSVVSVAGTLTGPRQVEKVVEVNGFDLEVPISEHMAFFRYVDRPGIVGTVGPAARRGGHQHRRHAGRARPPGRPGARRAHRRHRHPGRRARPTSRPRSAPATPGGRPRRKLSRPRRAAEGPGDAPGPSCVSVRRTSSQQSRSRCHIVGRPTTLGGMTRRMILLPRRGELRSVSDSPRRPARDADGWPPRPAAGDTRTSRRPCGPALVAEGRDRR